MSTIEITIYCVHDNESRVAVTIKGSDTTKTLYSVICEKLKINPSSVDLIYDGEIIPNNETRIETTELSDGIEIHIDINKKQMALIELKKRNLEPTPNGLCEAAGKGDCELIRLYLDAGVDVNCTKEETS